jgi:translation initiation factor IF-2
MPMDRLSRTFRMVGLALAVVPATAGCRSMRSDVPAGRPFASDGRTPQALNFGSSPNPSTAPLAPPISGTPGGSNPYGTPPPGGNPYGSSAPMGTSMAPGTSMPGISPTSGMSPAIQPSAGAAATPRENRWSTDPNGSGPQAPAQTPLN